jgi:hypothetical protein
MYEYFDDEITKDDVVESALDIYHAYDVSMEEAMDIALDEADEATKGYTINENPWRVPTDERQYHDLAPGYQRMLMQGILKWIEDYKVLPEGSAKTALGMKIYKWINNPINRNILMKSGYWTKVPAEIRKMAAGSSKYAKMGAKLDKQNAKAARKVAKIEARAAKKAAKTQAKAAKKAAKEAVLETALDMMNDYNIDRDEAMVLAMEYHGVDAYDMVDDDYADDYYDDLY